MPKPKIPPLPGHEQANESDSDSDHGDRGTSKSRLLEKLELSPRAVPAAAGAARQSSMRGWVDEEDDLNTAQEDADTATILAECATKADDLELDRDLLAEREAWGNKMEMQSLAKECSALVDQLRAAKADNAERLLKAARQLSDLIPVALQKAREEAVRQTQQRVWEKLTPTKMKAKQLDIVLDQSVLQTVESFLKRLEDPASNLEPTADKVNGELAYLEEFVACIQQSRRLPPTERELGALARHAQALQISVEKLLRCAQISGLPDTGSGPLGVATSVFLDKDFPELVFDERPGEVRFKKTAAIDAGRSYYRVLPVAKRPLGTIQAVDGGVVEARDAAGKTVSKVVSNAKTDWIHRRLLVCVSQATFGEVRIREMEHLADFARAFRLSAGTLAEAINDLAGQAFQSKEKAIKALVDRIPAESRPLIPSDVMDLPAWRVKAMECCEQLCALSKARDKPGDHCPTGYVGTESGDTVELSPEFGGAGVEPQVLISWARLGSS